jgi:alkylation response protein AidB-like acyl-CoA dehydrogenase
MPPPAGIGGAHLLEATRALYERAIAEDRLNSQVASVQCIRATHVQVQRAGGQLRAEAIRIYGGRALLKRYTQERYERDARRPAVNRPWTQDIASQRAWETTLAMKRSDASVEPDERAAGIASRVQG